MRGRLIGHYVRNDSSLGQLVINIGCVADETNRLWNLLLFEFLDKRHRFFKIIHHHIDVSNRTAALGAIRIYFDDESHAFVHGDRKRLSATHPAESGSEYKLSFERVPA